MAGQNKNTFGDIILRNMGAIVYAIVTFFVLLLLTVAMGEFDISIFSDGMFWLKWVTVVTLGTVGHHVFGNMGARKGRASEKNKNARTRQRKGYGIIANSNKLPLFENKIVKDDSYNRLEAWKAHIDARLHRWQNASWILFIWKTKYINYWKLEKKKVRNYELWLKEDNEDKKEEYRIEFDDFNVDNINIKYNRIHKQMFVADGSLNGNLIDSMEFNLHKRLLEMSLGMKIFSFLYTFMNTSILLDASGWSTTAGRELFMYNVLIAWNCSSGYRNAFYVTEVEETSTIELREQYQKKFIIEEGIIIPNDHVNGGATNENKTE